MQTHMVEGQGGMEGMPPESKKISPPPERKKIPIWMQMLPT